MKINEKRFSKLTLTVLAAALLNSCGSEVTSSHSDLDENEAMTALTSEFDVPIYPGSTLYESKRAEGMGKTTIAGSFHSPDSCPDISDWYSRRLRMRQFSVTGIEKNSSSCEVVANKGKEECKLTAKNDGSQTNIVITFSKPK